MMEVAIIEYGAGNLFSVSKAFERLGIKPVITADEAIIRNADRVVFPGVGHAKTAMDALRLSGLEQVVPALKQPVLGICLGMQLMCEWTEEGDVTGMGIFRCKVRSLRTQYRDIVSDINSSKNIQTPSKTYQNLQFPHMGWNDVNFGKVNKPYYFVHNYASEIGLDTWGIGSYGLEFAAALKRDNFYGVQFHPEKSGKNGMELLSGFISGNIAILPTN